jgi:hypothetical protein
MLVYAFMCNRNLTKRKHIGWADTTGEEDACCAEGAGGKDDATLSGKGNNSTSRELTPTASR